LAIDVKMGSKAGWLARVQEITFGSYRRCWIGCVRGLL
jgi:hypothetical protein